MLAPPHTGWSRWFFVGAAWVQLAGLLLYPKYHPTVDQPKPRSSLVGWAAIIFGAILLAASPVSVLRDPSEEQLATALFGGPIAIALLYVGIWIRRHAKQDRGPTSLLPV